MKTIKQVILALIVLILLVCVAVTALIKAFNNNVQKFPTIILSGSCTGLVTSGSGLSIPDTGLIFSDNHKMIPLNVESGSFQYSYRNPDNGYLMNYHLHIPESAYRNMPLIIYLHGIGEVNSVALLRENPLIVTMQDTYGDRFPAILLVPVTRLNSWTSESVTTTLINLIEEIVETYKIDRDKIIITGHSMGASGVFNLIDKYGDYFSAAVAISPPNPENIDPSTCLTVPIRTFANWNEDCDWVLPGLAEQINLVGGDVEHTTLDGYTHSQTPYGVFFKDLFEWMLQQ